MLLNSGKLRHLKLNKCEDLKHMFEDVILAKQIPNNKLEEARHGLRMKMEVYCINFRNNPQYNTKNALTWS